jgi:hypothetical protein
MRIAFRFEPLAPTAITVYLNQQLHRYQEQGLICEYKTHAKRLGKYHYQIQVDLDVTGRQAAYLLRNFSRGQISGFGRWLYD